MAFAHTNMIHIYIHICAYINMGTCMYKHAYTDIYICTYIYTDGHVHALA